jgi:hypothetical protein
MKRSRSIIGAEIEQMLINLIDNLLAELIQTAWRNRLIQPILTFFGEATPVNAE